MSQAAKTSQRRVLVTGAGGFVGSHLTQSLLKRGDRVVALDLDLSRLAALEGPANLELLAGDVTDRELQAAALRNTDTVFHLAAAHLERAAGEEHFRHVNVEGSRSLAAGALRAGVRRFVHCSSVGVYGRIRNPPADETTECRPELAYEQSKLAGEAAVREVAADGLPLVILRPVWIYGPGCPRTERLFESIRRGRFLVGGKGESLRHCIYIDDMVRALNLAASAEEAVGEVLVVGDARAVTVGRLVGEIALLVRARPPRQVPLGLLWLAAVLAEGAFAVMGREPPVSRRSLRFFTGNTAFDTARSRRLLGFEPQYDLEAGLAATYEALYRGSQSQPAGRAEAPAGDS
jgi:dihydroflavonol-4-reductase